MEQDETEPPLLHKQHYACNGCSGPNIDIAALHGLLTWMTWGA